MKKPIKAYVLFENDLPVTPDDRRFFAYSSRRFAERSFFAESNMRVREMYLVEEPNEKAD